MRRCRYLRKEDIAPILLAALALAGCAEEPVFGPAPSPLAMGTDAASDTAYEAFSRSYYALTPARNVLLNLYLIETNAADASGVPEAGSPWGVFLYRPSDASAWDCVDAGTGNMASCGSDQTGLGGDYTVNFTIFFTAESVDSPAAAAISGLKAPLRMRLLSPVAWNALGGDWPDVSPDEGWVVESKDATAVIDARDGHVIKRFPTPEPSPGGN